MYCIHCGKEIKESSKFCIYCGEKVEAAPVTPEIPAAPAEYEMPEATPPDKPLFEDMPNIPVVDMNEPEDYGPLTDSGTQTSVQQEDWEDISSASAEPSKPKSHVGLIVTIALLSVLFVILAAVGGCVAMGGLKIFSQFLPSGGFGGGSVSSTVTLIPGYTARPLPTTTPTPIPEALATPEATPTPTPTPTPPPPENLQHVVVESSGTSAKLYVEEYIDGEWVTLYTTNARVGNNGVSANYGEGKKHTPKGTFNILFAMGLSKPDTNLRYRTVQSGDVWVDDSNSEYYNTIQNGSANGRWSSAENIYAQVTQNYWTYCILFDFNGDCMTPGSAESGRGSAIYLGGMGYNGDMNSSYGDIKVTDEAIRAILSLLDSAKNPQIIIK